MPTYETAQHLRQLADKLEALERGEIKRLMVFMPPRHGKTEICSIRLPAWYLGRNPQAQIIACSYAEGLAYSNSYAVRETIESPRYQRLWPLKLDVAGAVRWQLAGKDNKRASYIAAGVGGGITGEGADCLPAGTMITTNRGLQAMENLQYSPGSCKILTYDTGKKELQWKSKEAFSVRPESWLYRITTASGRMVETTANHRIWTRGGYKRACEVTAGDSLVCVVRSTVQAFCLRDEKINKTRISIELLFGEMPECPRGNQESPEMYNLRKSCRTENAEVLQSVSSEASRTENRTPRFNSEMPDVQSGIQVKMAGQESGKVCNVLLESVCRAGPFSLNGGEEQSELAKRGESIKEGRSLGKSLSDSKATCEGTRRQSLCNMPFHDKTPYTPSRQLANEQCLDKPCHVMRNLSSKIASGIGIETITDIVSSIERLHAKTTVYDLQVSHNHNFFANGILVHNCLIIDDPIKNQEEAESEVYRQKIFDWYRTTARTRLQPNGKIVIIQTRWHVADLAGKILEQAATDKDADQWEILNLPAIKDNQALWPERYPLEALNNIRASIGSRSFESLYQGSPTQAEGAVFRRDWWRYYKIKPVFKQIIHSWDTAFKTKSSSDYSVLTVWGVTATGYYLLDVIRQRLELPDLKRTAILAAQRDKPSAIYIEDAASGQSLIQELRRETSLPIIPKRVDSDKVVRAYAVTPLIEAGRVYLPESAPWLLEFIEELSAFPNGEHDDEVDSLTLALRMMGNPSPYGFSISGDEPDKDDTEV